MIGYGTPLGARIAVAIGAVALAFGCTAASQSPEPADMPGWRPDSSQEPARGYRYPAQVFAEALENFTGGQEGVPGLAIELSEQAEHVVAISTESGMLDDSVEAVQQRLVLERRSDGLWWVRERGIRFRCYRGAQPGRWTTELCP